MERQRLRPARCNGNSKALPDPTPLTGVTGSAAVIELASA
jgi:hypothetical protein